VEAYPRAVKVHPEVVNIQAIARSSEEIKEQHVNSQNSFCHTIVVLFTWKEYLITIVGIFGKCPGFVPFNLLKFN
jgi:hypothetical protein